MYVYNPEVCVDVKTWVSLLPNPKTVFLINNYEDLKHFNIVLLWSLVSNQYI